MKNKYFNIELEFDKRKVDATIEDTISKNGKGYVCSIEANNLTVANSNSHFLRIVNGALVNICDGSVLSRILGIIHRKKFSPYIGADLFISYVEKCQYRQFFIGNTREVLQGLKNNLTKIDPKVDTMRFEELPFKAVDDFDYPAIANMINEDKPDIIWVSLGAPKQEFFMEKLLPHLNQGIMFGFGAIFNFNSGIGPVKRAPYLMRLLHLEWFYRAIEDPKKNIPRYWGFIKILPLLISKEYKLL